MKGIYIVCVLLFFFEVELISWAALLVLLAVGGWDVLNRCVDERERRYE